jgi:hypothetical protein
LLLVSTTSLKKTEEFASWNYHPRRLDAYYGGPVARVGELVERLIENGVAAAYANSARLGHFSTAWLTKSSSWCGYNEFQKKGDSILADSTVSAL